MEGFDNYVYLILQAHNYFKDVMDEEGKLSNINQGEDVQQYYQVKNGSRFIIPGE
jgi:hypothetical protein